MNIEDFLPKYPNIVQSEYDILNPYDNFYESIFKKNEFYENRITSPDDMLLPKEIGTFTKYQTTIARFLSSKTPYDRLLLVHAMGSGKTCSAIGAIEQIKNEENNNFKGALIIAKGVNILNNFLKQLIGKCTAGQYLPEKYEDMSERQKIHERLNAQKFYNKWGGSPVFDQYGMVSGITNGEGSIIL